MKALVASILVCFLSVADPLAAEEVSFSGTVIRCEPPNILVHTWDFEDTYSEVTYELEELGDRVRLVLTHRRLTADEMLGVLGGWHTHLDILEDVLEGKEPEAFWKMHTAHEAEYERRYN